MALKEFRRAEPTGALHRLLSESARSHAALGACGFPLALLDAVAPSRPVTYVNAAFEEFFGYLAADALGRPLASLLFHDDAPLVHRLLASTSARWKGRAWGKDGAPRPVEIALGAVHGADGQLTHWIAAFADRSEVEALRAELEGLKRLAAAA
jgi:PAS domain S-box-containing protein